MLSPYRVLDLADDRGILCGKILADLGADVLKVEPPWGDPARRVGPFYQDDPHPEKSLFWFAYAANKRGITLDLESPKGRQLLRRLISSAHFLVESFRPGYLADLGLDYSELKALNPALITVSITPFGQTGPYSGDPCADLVGMALGGFIYITGDADRPPVRVSSPQFYALGAAAGAAGAMIAHHHRMLTGKGQHVDVSCQQAVARTLSHAPQIWDLNRRNLKRYGPSREIGQANMRINWECRDGYVNFIMTGGVGGGRSVRGLSQWMDEEGMGDEFLRETRWEETHFGTVTQEALDRIKAPISRFFKSHTKRELGEGAIRRRITLFPVNDARDLLEYPQLRARGFFQELEHPELGTSITYPGAFIHSSETFVGLRRRAPLLGEHNQEVYCRELGMAPRELAELREAGVV